MTVFQVDQEVQKPTFKTVSTGEPFCDILSGSVYLKLRSGECGNNHNAVNLEVGFTTHYDNDSVIIPVIDYKFQYAIARKERTK